MLILVATAVAIELSDVPNPRDHGAWVTDLARVLPAETEERINARIDALHASTGAELAVVTVDDVRGTPKAFANALFAAWGVGRKEADDGVLMLLVLGRRRLEMETGYGLEGTLPDGMLGMMQAQWMVPHFRQGRFGEGLEAGVNWTVARLSDAGPAGPSGVAEEARLGPTDWTALALLLGLPGLLLGGAMAWIVVRRNRCPSCDARMRLLSEEEDDAHLDAGQIAEEHAGSRDWQVRVCDACGTLATRNADRWFSGNEDCVSCGYAPSPARRASSSTRPGTARASPRSPSGAATARTAPPGRSRRRSDPRPSPSTIIAIAASEVAASVAAGVAAASEGGVEAASAVALRAAAVPDRAGEGRESRAVIESTDVR